MRFSSVITSALAAAVVSAAPLEKRAVVTTWVVDVVTSYTTVYPGTPTPAASPAAAASPNAALQQGGSDQPSPAEPSTYVAPAPTPAASPAPAPAPSTPASSPSTSNPVASSRSDITAGSCPASVNADTSAPFDSCGVSVLEIANFWRVKYGKQPFTWKSNIASAAQHTSNYNQGGVRMVHPGLVDGSMGECITPGFWEIGSLATQGLTPFEVALMGWLCEVSSDPELQADQNDGIDVCNISSTVGGIDSSGEREHHDIFLSDSYTTIGIYYQNNVDGSPHAMWAGQWTADFA